MTVSLESSDFLDALLKCSMCLEIYKNPRRLPCLHSFCESCLENYVQRGIEIKTSSTENLKRKEDTLSKFYCPICRNDVVIEYNLSKSWLENLPDDFFIANLIDRHSIENESKTCDPCRYEGKQEPASIWCVNCTEALCKQCESYHQKFKSLRNHSFLDLHSLKTRQETATLRGFIPCPKHPFSQAQMYCIDHHAACCTLCATFHHRKCSDILTLENAAKDVKKEKVTLALNTTLDELVKNIQVKMSFCKERQKNLHVSKETIEQGVDTMINDFISHLESLRASFKQRLEKYEQDESKTLENQISNLSNLLSRAKYQKQLLTVSVEQGSNEECLVERENILKSEGEIKKNSSVFPVKIPYDGKLSFHADSEFLNLKSKLTTIGRYIELEKGCMKRRKIKMLYKKDLNCVICSAVFDHQGNIIIADYAHKKVFACDLSLNCKSTILVPGKPWDITCNRAGLIFVSLPFEREVIELDIKNGVVNKLFSTSANCRGLCWMNDKFYIASSIGLQIYSDVGVKEDEIQMFNTWMLSEKQDLDCILCTKNDELMEISVHSKKKKTLFERFGSVFRGISTDYEGNIYTVGMSSSKLYQLSSDGNLIRELNLKDFHLKGNLWSIRLSDKNKFVITTDEGCVALFEMTDDV